MKKTTLLPAPTAFCNLNAARRACLWAALGLLAALATVAPPARAAVTEAWVHRYSNVMTNANDEPVKVVRDAAGDIIVTGTTDDGVTGRDMLTIKYSGADGTVLWQKRYNGPANRDDYARAVAVDGSGNVVVTGFSENGTNGDYYTAKYAAADGALLWEKRYDGSANSYDEAQAVAVDGSGNVVVTGYSYGGGSGYDYYTAKYAAADGALLWEKRYNGPANSDDKARAVAVDSSGNVVVTGSSYNGTNGDYYTAKYAAADGALLWEKRYNGPANGWDVAGAMAVDGSGNVVLTGFSENGSSSDYYTAKYAAADGALLWGKRYNGPANSSDSANAVAVEGNGNVVVTGFSENGSNSDYYTAKYAAADGALLWEKRYDGSANSYDEAQAVAVDGSGNVVVTGYSYGSGSTCDYYTAKYAAADGALLWEKHYNGLANRQDEATAVAVDGSGNVVITGSSNQGAPNYDPDYYTAKFAAADGALLWEKRYNGPANRPGDAYANAVVVDGSGHVVVTGYSYNLAPNYTTDYYTARYAAANGALLWEKHSNGGGNAVAVDGGGNVVVTGYSPGTNFNADYYTAKYAAADGALLWERRYNAGDGQAQAVAVDGSGNVVVTGGTGWANGFGHFLDFYTAKYAAADGALLWEKRSCCATEGSESDGAAALAIDGSGNVVVTGDSGADYYTAKYAAADGALLWEQRGPGGYAQAVAVDGSGNVVVSRLSATVKYAAADGALLWERSGGGSLAVDGSGNVMVTGGTTAKYAAADGALLWEQRYSSGQATAVAVDNSGNVVVTGYSGLWPNNDYYTAKYAAADGALLWEKRYNSPANKNDYATSLAIGPNGMVAITGSSIGSSGTYGYATVVYRDLPPPLSFAGWAACFELSGVAGAAADPDSDGLPNGVEYILGGSPSVPGTSGRPAVTTSGGNVIFTFSREDGSETPDVSLTVETGTTLLTWPTVFNIGPNTAASSPGVSITENGTAADTITVTIAQGAARHMFARLRITIAP